MRNQRRAPKMSQKTIDANRKRFQECSHTAEGRFSKGDTIADYSGNLYRIETIGFRYHENVSSALYGAKPIRDTKEYAATRKLRTAIGSILQTGTHEPGSRGIAVDADAAKCPGTEKVAEWRDGRPGSLASFPYIQIYQGYIIRVIRPIYDDAPSIAWVIDTKLARALLAAIEISPKPVNFHEASVKARS